MSSSSLSCLFCWSLSLCCCSASLSLCYCWSGSLLACCCCLSGFNFSGCFLSDAVGPGLQRGGHASLGGYVAGGTVCCRRVISAACTLFSTELPAARVSYYRNNCILFLQQRDPSSSILTDHVTCQANTARGYMPYPTAGAMYGTPSH